MPSCHVEAGIRVMLFLSHMHGCFTRIRSKKWRRKHCTRRHSQETGACADFGASSPWKCLTDCDHVVLSQKKWHTRLWVSNLDLDQAAAPSVPQRWTHNQRRQHPRLQDQEGQAVDRHLESKAHMPVHAAKQMNRTDFCQRRSSEVHVELALLVWVSSNLVGHLLRWWTDSKCKHFRKTVS